MISHRPCNFITCFIDFSRNEELRIQPFNRLDKLCALQHYRDIYERGICEKMVLLRSVHNRPRRCKDTGHEKSSLDGKKKFLISLSQSVMFRKGVLGTVNELGAGISEKRLDKRGFFTSE